MKHGIVRYIVNNDSKGTTGVGTIHGMDVTVDGITTTHTWSLMEELQGKVDIKGWEQPAIDAIRTEREAERCQEIAQKQEQKDARRSAVTADPVLLQMIETVLVDPSSTKAIDEYRQGKEKALNALVGKVMKLAKQHRHETDAFAVNTLIVDQLKKS